jgi:ABC-type enterochelin transport system permease subunit
MMEMGLDAVNNLSSVFDFGSFDFASLNLNHWHLDWQIFAQQFNQDVTKDLAGGWNNFVRSGQVWALLIGVVLGYLFKSITSF